MMDFMQMLPFFMQGAGGQTGGFNPFQAMGQAGGFNPFQAAGQAQKSNAFSQQNSGGNTQENGQNSNIPPGGMFGMQNLFNMFGGRGPQSAPKQAEHTPPRAARRVEYPFVALDPILTDGVKLALLSLYQA